MGVAIREVEANGLRFRCREAAGGAEPVLLLHGFPETSAMWVPLMDRLAEVGYHCVAPDQRGYCRTARPDGVDAYRYEDLAGDVHGIASALGWEGFHLIGHDWGALAGWAALAADPAPVRSWTALSVPHPRAFALAVRDDPEEAWYRGYLELIASGEGAAEAKYTADDLALLRWLWRTASEERVQEYVAVMGEPGALTAALNWYRASDCHARALHDDTFEFGEVDTPTLLLWGKDDRAIRRMAVDLGAEHMAGPYRVVELDAGHFLVDDVPERVADEVLDHLRRHPL